MSSTGELLTEIIEIMKNGKCNHLKLSVNDQHFDIELHPVNFAPEYQTEDKQALFHEIWNDPDMFTHTGGHTAFKDE